MIFRSRLFSMTQEHGKVEPISGLLDYSKYPLGTMLTLIPYHVSIIPVTLTIVETLMLHYSPLSDPCLILTFTVVCNCNDAFRVLCFLWGPVAGEVDMHTWVVNRWWMDGWKQLMSPVQDFISGWPLGGPFILSRIAYKKSQSRSRWKLHNYVGL